MVANYIAQVQRSLWGWRAVMIKEWIELLHDPIVLAIVLMAPFTQLFIYGYGISFDVRNVETVVVDRDRRPKAQQFIDRLVATTYVRVTSHLPSREAAVRQIVANRARAGIIIPPDFSDKLERGEPGKIQILIDGSDWNIANAVQTASIAVGQNSSIQLLTESMEDGRRPIIDVRPRMLFNPDVNTTRFILPGVVGYICYMITMFLTVHSIVREREIGTLDQLLVTPAQPLGLMIGKLIPFVVIGFMATNVMLVVMTSVFRVPIYGSLALLEFCTLIFVLVAVSTGMLISTKSRTVAQATHMAVFTIMPSLLLSGFVFPRETMPYVLFLAGYLIPLTHFLQIQRGIILRGAGLEDLWPWILSLIAFAVVLIYFSVRRFRADVA